MPAGTNLKVQAIRLIYIEDDDVGGSTPSGTILHSFLDARFDEESTNTQLLQQGLESKKVFSGMVWGHQLQIREQDEIVVVSPSNHKYFGKYFRVEDAQYDGRHPGIKQGYLLVKLTRSQVAHGEIFQ